MRGEKGGTRGDEGVEWWDRVREISHGVWWEGGSEKKREGG